MERERLQCCAGAGGGEGWCVGDEMKRKLCTGPWEYEKRSEGKKGNRGMQKRESGKKRDHQDLI
jgi:hypothetical protein